MVSGTREKQGKLRELNILFKKYDKAFRSYNEISNFNEPVVLLMRRNGEVTFMEGAKSNRLEYEHSSGQERYIELDRKFLVRFPYGKKTFSGYICDEDFPLPINAKSVDWADMYQLGIEKTLVDAEKWKASKERGIGLKWKNILIGIAGVLAVIIGLPIVAGLFGVDLSVYLPWMNKATPAPSVPTVAEFPVLGVLGYKLREWLNLS